MSLADARILFSLIRGLPKSGSHAERIENFYARQATHYDAFRDRLLPGRRELVEMMPIAPGDRVVELGCGTGRNLEFLGARLRQAGRIDLVDLCPSLLAQAKARWREAPNVHVTLADACHWRPDGKADVVYFAYALTMIPQWQVALVNALAMLRPGGTLCVVDFTLPPPSRRVATRFWRAWFGHDGVHLDRRHPALLQRLLPAHRLLRAQARLPYLPGLHVPYYLFTGVKP